jgi:single-stranded DNA-binding protein
VPRNRVELEGKIVSEPRRSRTPAGTAVVSFRVRVEAEPEVTGASGCTIAVVSLGEPTGELANGSEVAIEGKLAERRWTTQSGLKQSRLELLALAIRRKEPSHG